MPRRRIGRFSPIEGGVSLSRLNRIAEAVERLDRVHGGMPFTGSINASQQPAQTSLVMVRMTENIGPDESSEFRDRQGVVQRWDPSLFKWMDTYPEVYIDVVCQPFGHFPVPRDSVVLCWYSKQAGKYVVINNPQIIHAVTCEPADPETPYPTTGTNGVYPIAFVTTSFSNNVNSSLSHSIMDDDVERLTPSPPHGGKNTEGDPPEEGDRTPYTVDTKYGYVCNIGPSYIPSGTVIHCWFAYGQLYTFYGGASGLIAKTQTDGISAASGTDWPLVLGYGHIEIGIPDPTASGRYISSGENGFCYNSTFSTIPGNTFIQCKYIDGSLFVDVESCNGS